MWTEYRQFVENFAQKVLVARAHARGVSPPDRSLAQDVAQTVFAAFWEHLLAEKYLAAGERDIRTWLCRVTVRNAYRSAGGSYGRGEVDLAAELPDPKSPTEAACCVHELFNLLPERNAVALVALAEGVSHEQLAEELDTTVEASRALRKRAAARARELLAA